LRPSCFCSTHSGIVERSEPRGSDKARILVILPGLAAHTIAIAIEIIRVIAVAAYLGGTRLIDNDVFVASP
jgi:hypothetical protein